MISRNSAFVYKGKPINAQSVANELGVQYVVEGSVRRAGSRVRITAQLIDAETGRHLWAERYDQELADIFAIQDEVTFRLGRSSIFPIKGIRVKRCAVKCSSLIISQRCSGRRPEAFSLGRRQPRGATAVPSATAMPADESACDFANLAPVPVWLGLFIGGRFRPAQW